MANTNQNSNNTGTQPDTSCRIRRSGSKASVHATGVRITKRGVTLNQFRLNEAALLWLSFLGFLAFLVAIIYLLIA